MQDVRAAMAVAAARFHGDPTAELAVVGITGTSGKTTTTHLVRHLLEAGGRPCGLLGGVTAGAPQVTAPEPWQALAPAVTTAAAISAWSALRPMGSL